MGIWHRWSHGLVMGCYLVGGVLFLRAGVPFASQAWKTLRAVHLDSRSSGGGAKLVVLFRPEDCDSHQPVLAALNAVNQHGSVPVQGLVLGDPGAATWSMEPSFPVHAGAAGHLASELRRMGYTRTPIVLMIDPRGRPGLIMEASDRPWSQVEAVRLAEQLALRQSPTRGI